MTRHWDEIKGHDFLAAMLQNHLRLHSHNKVGKHYVVETYGKDDVDLYKVERFADKIIYYKRNLNIS